MSLTPDTFSKLHQVYFTACPASWHLKVRGSWNFKNSWGMGCIWLTGVNFSVLTGNVGRTSAIQICSFLDWTAQSPKVICYIPDSWWTAIPDFPLTSNLLEHEDNSMYLCVCGHNQKNGPLIRKPRKWLALSLTQTLWAWQEWALSGRPIARAEHKAAYRAKARLQRPRGGSTRNGHRRGGGTEMMGPTCQATLSHPTSCIGPLWPCNHVPYHTGRLEQHVSFKPNKTEPIISVHIFIKRNLITFKLIYQGNI